MKANGSGTLERSPRQEESTVRQQLLDAAESLDPRRERSVRELVDIEQTSLGDYTMRYTCAHCGHDSDTVEEARDHECETEDLVTAAPGGEPA